MPSMRAVQVALPKALYEVFPLERAADAYERMLSGGARFRVVLTTGN